MVGHSHPVLVVDDEAALAELLSIILSDAGYEVIVATNGDEALRRVHSDSPCLVLCDLSMPGMSGMKVLQSLREDPATADLPVVLMSGFLPTSVGQQPNAFLQKPFMTAEVLQVIAELMPAEVMAA